MLALDPKDIDEIVLGNFNAGMNALAFPSSLALAGTPRPGPAARDARRDRMCVRVSAATVQVRLGVQISVISIGDSITDPDGALAQVSGLDAGGAVLVRPDNHIGWRSAAPSTAPAEDLLDAVTRLLHR